ncbi:MAG: fatty acid oxidation complex subunit alpha FadJ [Polyangiaceae bacterium]
MTQTSVTPASVRAPGKVLRVDLHPEGCAIITYDVPGEAVNTIKPSFTDELAAVLSQIERDPQIKAAVLISGKPDGFIAGADITMLGSITTAEQGQAMVEAGHRSAQRLADAPKPIVAAVHGAALGGGFEVALACHARVLSDDKKTVLGLPEVQLGLLPGLNGLQRLAMRTGLQVALDYGLTGKTMRPAKAKSLGVADDVVPQPILLEVAVELALSLAESHTQGRPLRTPAKKARGADAVTRAALEDNPLGRSVLFKQAKKALRKKTGGHYPAPERIVSVLEAFASDGFEASKAVEAKAFGELLVGETSHRLQEIFFATTALKKDNGVDDPTVKAREVKKVAMLGAGLMGAGIAYVTTSLAGIPVRLKDKDDASLGRGLKYVSDILDERLKKRQITSLDKDRVMSQLTGTVDYSGMKNVDLVIEAVFEDLAIKHRVVREVESDVREGAIFASNTSSLPIGRIAEASRHPENVVGMHYFSPVHKMPLLEVIRTSKTSPEVVATAVAVGKKQGKTVIVVNDGVGFYTSRILGPYMNEASWLLTEGVAIETIDKALVAWGWPVGPMTLLDEVGIDVAAHVGPIMLEAFGDRIEPPATMAKLAADGRKGKKNQRGMYLYGDEATAKKTGLAALLPGKKKSSKQPDPSVYGILGLATPEPGAHGTSEAPVPIEEIQMRCTLQLVNEAIHCLGEGILRSARDGDIGAIFGLGFPPFRGGPFRYVDSIGAAETLRRIEGYQQRYGKRWAPAPKLVEMAKTNARFYP